MLTVGAPYDSFPNGATAIPQTWQGTIPPATHHQMVPFTIQPIHSPDDVWRERVKTAGIIGFLKGCLEGVKWEASESVREKIDAVLKRAEEMELRQ